MDEQKTDARERVRAVIAEMEAAGEKLTVRTVQAKAGGSKDLAAEMLREHRGQLPPKVAAAELDAEMASLRAEVRSLTVERDQARAEVEQKRTALGEAVAERDAARLEAARFQGISEGLNHALQVLDGQMKALTAAVEKQQRTEVVVEEEPFRGTLAVAEAPVAVVEESEELTEETDGDALVWYSYESFLEIVHQAFPETTRSDESWLEVADKEGFVVQGPEAPLFLKWEDDFPVITDDMFDRPVTPLSDGRPSGALWTPVPTRDEDLAELYSSVIAPAVAQELRAS